MLFSSMSQLIVLVVLFFGGVMIGLGLHPGGKKWRRRFEDESANYAQFRRDADAKMRDANTRIGELERLNAEVEQRETATRRQLRDAEAQRAAPARPAADLPQDPPVAAAQPAPARNGGSGTGGPPDLGRIRGIDPALRNSLFGLGVTRFEDIAELSAVDEMALERRLELPAGYITREQWRDQAALLVNGQDAEQAERFPPR